METIDSLPYNHVPSKVVKTIKVRYKNVGKLAPREVVVTELQ